MNVQLASPGPEWPMKQRWMIEGGGAGGQHRQTLIVKSAACFPHKQSQFCPSDALSRPDDIEKKLSFTLLFLWRMLMYRHNHGLIRLEVSAEIWACCSPAGKHPHRCWPLYEPLRQPTKRQFKAVVYSESVFLAKCWKFLWLWASCKIIKLQSGKSFHGKENCAPLATCHNPTTVKESNSSILF